MEGSSVLHCASCGRLDKPGPDGVETVFYLEKKWCVLCADVGRTVEGAAYVSQPSPGQMVDGPVTDLLVTWQDCFSMQPKKRILLKKVKAEIQRAWILWDEDKNNDTSMFVFYGWLSRFRPYFLTFRCKTTKWQTVHSWLLQAHDGSLL